MKHTAVIYYHVREDILSGIFNCDVFDMIDFRGGILQDVSEAYVGDWDLMIAHPPCTYLAVSGLHWNKKRPERSLETAKALDFVRTLMAVDIEKIVIENPVSCISSKIRKPDQIIEPWMFGDMVSKKTCLWLKNVKKLIPQNTIKPELEYVEYGKNNRMQKWMYDIRCQTTKNGHRANLASKTFPGMAKAMAEQWTNTNIF